MLLILQSGVDNKVGIQVVSNDDTDTASAASSTHGHLSSLATHSDNSVNAGAAVVASIAADADTILVKEARISASLGDKPHQGMIQYILTRLKLVPNTLNAATPTSNDGDIIR
jgi:ribosomal protein L18